MLKVFQVFGEIVAMSEKQPTPFHIEEVLPQAGIALPLGCLKRNPLRADSTWPCRCLLSIGPIDRRTPALNRIRTHLSDTVK